MLAFYVIMNLVIIMKTKIINEIKKGKYYYYELEETIFFVEGGGQMKDEGTINGIEVLSCFESDGHIYHQTQQQIKDIEVELYIDEKHRYISRQGHTAQHLLSAAIYELYNIKTVSHHYNLEGSYIDVDVACLNDEQLKSAENWVNEKIREHRDIEILYPTKEEFLKLSIHHEIKVEEDIRIVHIKGVEYNPCKGMHVSNTAEVQCLVILGTERIKGSTRIHYMFGDVARNHFHTYYKELKNISVEVSKPMNDTYNGVLKVKQGKDEIERFYNDLSNQYIELLSKQYEHETFCVIDCQLDAELLNKFCLRLSEFGNLQCFVFTNKQIIAIAGKNANKNAKTMFDELKQQFNIRGGGNPKICRGTSEDLGKIKTFVENLKNG